jgi:hypothetical protein
VCWRTDYRLPRKIDSNEKVSEYAVQQFGLENLDVVWPAKLTLAPLAADRVLSKIDSVVRKRTQSKEILDWNPGVPVGSHPWDVTQHWRAWNQFVGNPFLG